MLSGYYDVLFCSVSFVFWPFCSLTSLEPWSLGPEPSVQCTHEAPPPVATPLSMEYFVTSPVKAKFHYVMWSQTGPNLVADLSQTCLLVP